VCVWEFIFGFGPFSSICDGCSLSFEMLVEDIIECWLAWHFEHEIYHMGTGNEYVISYLA
jgi:hypothetical protein